MLKKDRGNEMREKKWRKTSGNEKKKRSAIHQIIEGNESTSGDKLFLVLWEIRVLSFFLYLSFMLYNFTYYTMCANKNMMMNEMYERMSLNEHHDVQLGNAMWWSLIIYAMRFSELYYMRVNHDSFPFQFSTCKKPVIVFV